MWRGVLTRGSKKPIVGDGNAWLWSGWNRRCRTSTISAIKSLRWKVGIGVLSKVLRYCCWNRRVFFGANTSVLIHTSSINLSTWPIRAFPFAFRLLSCHPTKASIFVCHEPETQCSYTGMHVESSKFALSTQPCALTQRLT